MSDLHDLSFCDLRAKEVVNTADGKKLGRITDITFSSKTGCIKGIIVPLCRRGFFSKSQDIYIPWECVHKIGEDVIIVNLFTDSCGNFTCRNAEPDCCDDFRCNNRNDCGDSRNDCCDSRNDCSDSRNNCCDSRNDCGDSRNNCCDNRGRDSGRGSCSKPSCDGRCEKCMLFDCAYRWKNVRKCDVSEESKEEK